MRDCFLVISLLIGLSSAGQIQTQIAAKQVDSAPWAIFPRTYHENFPIQAAVSPAIQNMDGMTVDIYITTNRSMEEWNANSNLVDMRSTGAQTVSFSGTDLQELIVDLQNTDELDGIAFDRPGVAYDLVIDIDQNGELGGMDLIDGYTDEGMVVVSDLHEPGPHSVDSLEYDSPFGQWQTFRVYYPTDIESMEAQPLLIISHGWTHNYWYYSHLGNHLASYGYVVMSHENDVGNGGALASTTASESALQNIDTMLTVYPTLGGGILAGKIDKTRIVHSGHSTGGECVTRAYNRLFNGDYVSPHISHENIVCVNSIAGVAFLPATDVHPQGSNFHLYFAGADTDVSGAPVDGYQQAFSTYERGYGNKQVTYIHGAGHEDLHNNPGASWAEGPELIGRPATHTVMLPYFVALCELYTRDNVGMKDFFTRNKNEFRPHNIAEEIVVSGEYRDAISAGNTVIDDFENNNEIGTSSSGGTVNSTIGEHHELLMQDIDGSFNFYGNNWANGMTRARYDDDPNCAVLAWGENSQMDMQIISDISDWTMSDHLSFRSCQLTRHPLNDTTASGINYTVKVTDIQGVSSSLNISAYGEISPPYPRGAQSASLGSIIDICLPEGTYTIEVGGSQWESEMSFDIPGYVGGGAGDFVFEVGSGDPCTEMQVFLYDSWGDGWDEGLLEINNSDGVLVLSTTLADGFGPAETGGWQNEFHTTRIRLTDFLQASPNLDLNNIVILSFLFGPDYGSVTGAIGLDDIELVNDELTFTTEIQEIAEENFELLIFPNPATNGANVIFGEGRLEWSCELRDAQGRIIRQKANIRSNRAYFSTSELSSGVYSITIISAGESHTEKLMVK